MCIRDSLGEVGSAEGNCNSCGVEESHVRERTTGSAVGAFARLYNLEEIIARPYNSLTAETREERRMDDTEQPTLRALFRRRDLGLGLISAEEDLPAGALDRPLRWVHSSDLADPTPFLAEDLALLTTGTQFDAGTDVDVYVGPVSYTHLTLPTICSV